MHDIVYPVYRLVTLAWKLISPDENEIKNFPAVFFLSDHLIDFLILDD